MAPAIRWAGAVVIAALAISAAATHASVAGVGCAANLANGLHALGGARQLITVETARARVTVGSLRLWQRLGPCWTPVSGVWPARVGRNGISGHKHEGDGTTPAGIYPIGPVVYGIAANPGTRLAFHRLSCGDWWDEDPRSPTYNTYQRVSCGQRPPFAGASEALWKATVAYRRFAVVQYNVTPAIPGRGSAIFLHDDLGHPTAGCISLPPGELDLALRWLRPSPRVLIALGTRAELRGS